LADEVNVELEFTCTELPAIRPGDILDLRLGIQEGKVVVEDVPVDTGRAVFRFPLRVRRNAKTGRPNFLGPYAQGTPARRFVYLCWGERSQGSWRTTSRAKIYLDDLSWAQIDDAVQDGRPLQATIRMVDVRGRRIAASVAPEQIMWA
jgi:hypothetical protein